MYVGWRVEGEQWLLHTHGDSTEDQGGVAVAPTPFFAGFFQHATLEATQVEILSQSPTDVTSGR